MQLLCLRLSQLLYSFDSGEAPRLEEGEQADASRDMLDVSSVITSSSIPMFANSTLAKLRSLATDDDVDVAITAEVLGDSARRICLTDMPESDAIANSV